MAPLNQQPATSNQQPLTGDVVANFTAANTNGSNRTGKPKPEPKIIHQTFFKSVGPRTYAAQIKEIANGNHLLVLTEGKRDEKTDEVRKTRLFVYAEDFPELFKMLDDVRAFIDAHPVPKAVQARRQKFWERNNQTAPKNTKAAAEPSEAEAEADDELDR